MKIVSRYDSPTLSDFNSSAQTEKKLGELVGKCLRIAVRFYNARIYSFRGDYHIVDAFDLRRINDGLPIDTKRFETYFAIDRSHNAKIIVKKIRLLCVADCTRRLLAALLVSAATAGDVIAEPFSSSQYEGKVLPLLKKYCGDCHTRGAAGEKRWAFDAYAGYEAVVADQPLWSRADQLLRNRLMPPPGQSALTDDERQILLHWIDEEVFYVDPAHPDPGRTTLRRLNRSEYDNSIRDVFDVDLRPAEQFPPDDAGYGFDNIGEVLTFSPLHLEKYQAAARDVAAEAVRLSPPFRLGVDLPPERLTVFTGKPLLKDDVLLLRSTDEEVGTVVEVPLSSVYRILARLAVSGSGPDDRPRVEVLLSGKKLAELAPTTAWTGKAGFFPGTSAYVELPAGKHHLTLRMAKPNDESTIDAEKPPVVAVGFYELSGPFTPLPPRPSSFLRRELSSKPLAPPILYLSGEDLNPGTGRSGSDTGRIWFASNGYRHGPVILPTGGTFRVRMKVGAQ